MAHDDDAALHAEMTALVAELAPDEGMTHSLLEGVAFGRSNKSLPRTPVLHDPCVVIVCSGRKRGYFGDQVIEYGAHQFMVASVPMPFEGETFASPQDPLLVIKVKLDLAVIADLALAIDPAFAMHVAAAVEDHQHVPRAAHAGSMRLLADLDTHDIAPRRGQQLTHGHVDGPLRWR